MIFSHANELTERVSLNALIEHNPFIQLQNRTEQASNV